jgi:hypothetical protein
MGALTFALVYDSEPFPFSNIHFRDFDSTAIIMIPLSKSWGRLLFNFVVFHTCELCIGMLMSRKADIFSSVLIYLHYLRESVSGWCLLCVWLHWIQVKSERRLYSLRDQLKIQFKVKTNSVPRLGYVSMVHTIFRQHRRLKSMSEKLPSRKGGSHRTSSGFPHISHFSISFSFSVMSSMISCFPADYPIFALQCSSVSTGPRSVKHSLWALIFPLPRDQVFDSIHIFIYSASRSEYGSIWSLHEGPRNWVQCPLWKSEHDVERYMIIQYPHCLMYSTRVFIHLVLNDVLDLCVDVSITQIWLTISAIVIEWTAAGLNLPPGFATFPCFILFC